MEPFAATLATRIRAGHAEMMALARRRVADAGMNLQDEELEQLVNGFEAMLLEALEARGTETRDFYVETAIPAVVSSGEVTSDELAGSTAAWAVLLSAFLVEELGGDERHEATAWLSTFFSDYAAASARAAREAS